MPTTMPTTKKRALVPRRIPTKIPDAVIRRDAKVIRDTLRKYQLDPDQYEGFLPLHPASIENIERGRCFRVTDILSAMYERDYIYAAYERELSAEIYA